MSDERSIVLGYVTDAEVVKVLANNSVRQNEKGLGILVEWDFKSQGIITILNSPDELQVLLQQYQKYPELGHDLAGASLFEKEAYSNAVTYLKHKIKTEKKNAHKLIAGMEALLPIVIGWISGEYKGFD